MPDFLEIEGGDSRPAPLGSIDARADPVCPRHEVVTQKWQSDLSHVSQELDDCPQLGPIVFADLDLLDRLRMTPSCLATGGSRDPSG